MGRDTNKVLEPRKDARTVGGHGINPPGWASTPEWALGPDGGSGVRGFPRGHRSQTVLGVIVGDVRTGLLSVLRW